jgi:alpha-glucosidase
MSAPAWWQRGAVYQIYPRSFADGNGDGVGDLRGITAHLEHLSSLAVEAIWLSPIFTSPMADFGYDVSDYCDVDPIFGTLDDFDELVARAHDRGIKVVLDWVPNHSSDRHPWFAASRRRRDDPKRDWYVWRDPAPDGGPPNDWQSVFRACGAAWTLDERTGQYYLHSFMPEQPDLNWDNPEVEAAMHDVLRFWLDRGVDGFRMDVVHLIGKGEDLPDLSPDEAKAPVAFIDVPATHGRLREIRAVLDSYPGERTSVGEVFLLDPVKVADYYGDGDELHLSFNFTPLFSRWRADSWARNIHTASKVLDAAGHWATWVLSNHDNPRHRTRYGGSEARARAAAVLLLTLRGTPFLYAGEELGLEDAVVPPEREVDPGGRDGCRAPIPWTPEPDHGWGTTDPWLPWPPDAETSDAASRRADPGSILYLYRTLLAERRASPALSVGAQDLLDAPEGVLAWDRTEGGDRRRLLVNFTGAAVPVGDLGDGWTVRITSDGGATGGPLGDDLGPDQAVVLGPA